MAEFDSIEIPDHVPVLVTAAEGYRFLRGLLLQAAELPEDECRTLIRQLADGMEDAARDLQRGDDDVLRLGLREPGA